MTSNNKDILKSFRQDTIVFIDGANLFYAQKTLGAKIDYQRLYDFLNQYKRIVEIRIYLAFDHESEKEKEFLMELKQIGYIVISKELKIIQKGNEKKIRKGDLDIELALDAFELQNSFRTFVLFSGDSDFTPLISRLKENKKRIIVFSTRGHISKELYSIANKYIDMKAIKENVKKSRQKPGSNHPEAEASRRGRKTKNLV